MTRHDRLAADHSDGRALPSCRGAARTHRHPVARLVHWPSAGQSVSSSWNANVTGDGRHVHVTNTDSNAELAPHGGTSATFGFVGANNGANPSPTSFTLNGTACRTLS
ncbi:cellulose binding domain-containing protein [Streptomyces sp. NPDC047813]|uniref:cellulose binding domain-containing protein n=1 Tax=Streptomyces sp. NPDC047813 TaxID=3154608 RepID=UPI0033E32786